MEYSKNVLWSDRRQYYVLYITSPRRPEVKANRIGQQAVPLASWIGDCHTSCFWVGGRCALRRHNRGRCMITPCSQISFRLGLFHSALFCYRALALRIYDSTSTSFLALKVCQDGTLHSSSIINQSTFSPARRSIVHSLRAISPLHGEKVFANVEALTQVSQHLRLRL